MISAAVLKTAITRQPNPYSVMPISLNTYSKSKLDSTISMTLQGCVVLSWTRCRSITLQNAAASVISFANIDHSLASILTIVE
ncbi:hypothetical protein BVRB_042690, partial [Beta vulgaris subsp. vulgaris]